MNWFVSISHIAEEELEEARVWYESKSPGLGMEFLLSIEEMLTRIEENPKIFPVRIKALRGAPLKRFPFLILYRTIDSTVVIVAIANTNMDPMRWENR